MVTIPPDPPPDPGDADDPEVPDPVTAAVAAGDDAGLLRLMADDVVVHSPVFRLAFRGRDLVGTLLGAMVRQARPRGADVLGVWTGEGTHVIAFRMRLAGRDLDLVNISRLDGRGRIREVTTYGRPMASVAAFPAVVFPRIVTRHRGRVRGLLAWLLGRPLPRLLELGVRLAVRVGLPPEARLDPPVGRR